MANPATYCADCSSEYERVTSLEAGTRDPDLIDAQVWACPVCPEAWAPSAIDGVSVGLAASSDSGNARASLRERQDEWLIGEALLHCSNGRVIDQGRIDRLDIEWSAEVWRALNGAAYAHVVRHTQIYCPMKAT